MDYTGQFYNAAKKPNVVRTTHGFYIVNWRTELRD